MAVVDGPDLQQVRQQLLDEVVEDLPVDDQPLRGQRLHRVVQQKQRPVLRNALLALDGGQEGRKQLGPIARDVEPGANGSSRLERFSRQKKKHFFAFKTH
jgi:hypothetical protein